MKFSDILDKMIELDASDIFIRAYSPLRARIYTEIKVIDPEPLNAELVSQLIDEILPEEQKDLLKRHRSCEFASWYGENWRIRVGVFYQRNTLSAVIRKIDLNIPTFEQLQLPQEVFKKFCQERRGLILLTGITGSGKSTTIASMIEYINENYGRHILTVEEPIEFTFTDKKAIINQREVGKDVFTYEEALRQFALHSPDVIFIGNIRDQRTCHAALTAAETGVLVLSTLHTVNASSTVERIVNFFPPHQHNLILTQLSYLLKGVVTQRLIPRKDKAGLIPAYEIMTLSPSVSRLLRENKTYEIPKYIASGDIYGMKSFSQCLIELVSSGKITPQHALEYADKKEELEMQLRNKGLL